MGIRKLNKFLINKGLVIEYSSLYDYINHIKTSKCNNSLNGKIIIAIDFWLYAHKFLHSTKSSNIVMGFCNQILKFYLSGAIPLYVIDGTVPIEKEQKTIEREKKREQIKTKITNIDSTLENYVNLDDIAKSEIDIDELKTKKEKLQKQIKRIKPNELNNIIKLFELMNVPYIHAEYEADALCAKLYKERIITSCLSDDMDILTLGCGSMIKFQEGKIYEFNLEYINKSLEYTQDQLIDLCIMFGCDYLQHSVRLDCDIVYDLIRKYGSILDILSSNEHDVINMSNSSVKIIGENYYYVRDIYIESPNREDIPDDFYNIKPQYINDSLFIDFIKNIIDQSNVIKSIHNGIYKINYLISKKIL